MSRRTFFSGCPTRPGKVRAARWSEGDQPHSRVLKRFEFEFLWLRDSDTVHQLLWDGKLLKDLQTTSDFYGYLTSMDDHCAEARANALGLTRSDRLETVKRVIITDTPVISLPQQFAGRPGYEPCDQYMIGSDEELAKVEGGQGYDGHYLQPVTVADEIVWSSKWSEKQCAETLRAFREKWQAVPA